MDALSDEGGGVELLDGIRDCYNPQITRRSQMFGVGELSYVASSLKISVLNLPQTHQQVAEMLTRCIS